MSDTCKCGHPRSHHYHRPRKPPSRITPREDAHGVDYSPGKCLSATVCDCRKFASGPTKLTPEDITEGVRQHLLLHPAKRLK